MIKNVLIRTVEEAEVPAREAGALASILVRAGDVVTAGQIVARIDNQLQRLQLQRTQLELAVARRELDNQAPLDLAAKALELQKQMEVQQEMTQRIARKKSENLYKIDAATKQMNVAKNELDRVLHARKEFRDSISDSEIDARKLTFEHADLTAKQTLFDSEIDVLLAEAEVLASHASELSVQQAQLQVDDAVAKRDVTALQLQLKENQVEMALEALDRRELKSPIDGIVVRVDRNLGEWIEPGDPCVRIVSLQTLRAEGFLSAQYASRISAGARATIILQLPGENSAEIPGVVTFISPEIDPVNLEVRCWVELNNDKLELRPGIHGVVKIQVPAL